MIYKYNFCIITYIFLYAFMHIVQVTIGYTRNAHHIESGNKEDVDDGLLVLLELMNSRCHASVINCCSDVAVTERRSQFCGGSHKHVVEFGTSPTGDS